MKNNNHENKYVRNLFSQFSKELPSFYRIKKHAPFHYCYWWFSTRKIDKMTARIIMKKWFENKLCVRVTYCGIKIERSIQHAS